MKLNFILTIVTICICSLIAYAFYSYSPTETKMIYTVGSFIFLLISGVGLMALSFKQPKTTINIKTVSGIFFLLSFILNILSSILKFKEPTYIITFGLLFLVYVLISYSIVRQQQ